MSKLTIFVFLLNSIVFSSSNVFMDEFVYNLIPLDANLCDPVSACTELGTGTAVPNPRDCNSYYYCVDVNGESVPSDSSIPCPEGQSFNSTTAICEVGSEPCTNTCAVNTCGTVCVDVHDVLGFPVDCHKYYICIQGGDKVEATCPAEFPYFDGTTCTTSSASCCDFCTATCEASGVQIADPNDCRQFYVCTEIGTPAENTHLTCTEGFIFDADSRTCVVGDTCTALCDTSATTPSGGKTTTTSPSEGNITTTTSPTAPPTTTTSYYYKTTTIPINNQCPSTYVCTINGNFPRCDYCDRSYFNCNNGIFKIKNCNPGTVFNSNANYPYCVLPENCPYPF